MYILLLLIIISAICVILSKNMIQSVLYLIIVYFLGSLLFIYLGAEFIGLILLIVYIGAISVLFLFVIMMLNVRILEIYSTYSIYLPLAMFLSIIFFFLVLLIYWNNLNVIELDVIKPHVNWVIHKNIKIIAIGELLFNEGYILFIGATLLLFVAMIGAIILTLDKVEKKVYLAKTPNVLIWKYSK